MNMMLGEMVFGGLDTGLYSIILVAILGLFLTGLMVGRTPEYLGKKIDPGEIRWVMIFMLAGPFVVLVLTAIAVVTSQGTAGLTTNSSSHGFVEVLYAYQSSMANNGQAFAGLSANSPFYNITTSIAMLVGRFGLAIPALALAGLFARQARRPLTVGKVRTDNVLFAGGCWPQPSLLWP